jgi:hypothetical protein
VHFILEHLPFESPDIPNPTHHPTSTIPRSVSIQTLVDQHLSTSAPFKITFMINEPALDNFNNTVEAVY